MDPSKFWTLASDKERETLADVYSRLRSLRGDWTHAVCHALALEIFEDYDYRSWSDTFLLSDVVPICQQYVTLFSEASQIDRIQRANYLQLVFGGRQRQDDVAYGLSEPFLWSDKNLVTSSLIAMGRRSYPGKIPTSHDHDNGILHVAVSYKHTSRHYQGGTISPSQAEAIWLAIKGMQFLTEGTRVRV